jgi:hypothetical protein
MKSQEKQIKIFMAVAGSKVKRMDAFVELTGSRPAKSVDGDKQY